MVTVVVINALAVMEPHSWTHMASWHDKRRGILYGLGGSDHQAGGVAETEVGVGQGWDTAVQLR